MNYCNCRCSCVPRVNYSVGEMGYCFAYLYMYNYIYLVAIGEREVSEEVAAVGKALQTLVGHMITVTEVQGLQER